MIIEKICQHFIYQDDVNGEMAISCCTAMKEPHQDHEGNDKMYPCPLEFEAKPCYKVLSLGSDKVHQPTNADRIRSMSDEELAELLARLISIHVKKMMQALRKEDCLVKEPVAVIENPYIQRKEHLDWLKAETEGTE